MRLIKWAGHPVVVIVLYLLLIIEGNEFGGFFMLYLLLSLPHGSSYALAAVFGIAVVVLAFNVNSKKNQFSKIILYVFGFVLMIAGLALFFSMGNKWQTFKLAVPSASFILFGISSVCFILRTLNEFVIYMKSNNKFN